MLLQRHQKEAAVLIQSRARGMRDRKRVIAMRSGAVEEEDRKEEGGQEREEEEERERVEAAADPVSGTEIAVSRDGTEIAYQDAQSNKLPEEMKVTIPYAPTPTPLSSYRSNNACPKIVRICPYALAGTDTECICTRETGAWSRTSCRGARRRTTRWHVRGSSSGEEPHLYAKSRTHTRRAMTICAKNHNHEPRRGTPTATDTSPSQVATPLSATHTASTAHAHCHYWLSTRCARHNTGTEMFWKVCYLPCPVLSKNYNNLAELQPYPVLPSTTQP
eukprot:2898194-Rhodomonas_salina.3